MDIKVNIRETNSINNSLDREELISKDNKRTWWTCRTNSIKLINNKICSNSMLMHPINSRHAVHLNRCNLLLLPTMRSCLSLNNNNNNYLPSKCTLILSSSTFTHRWCTTINSNRCRWPKWWHQWVKVQQPFQWPTPTCPQSFTSQAWLHLNSKLRLIAF